MGYVCDVKYSMTAGIIMAAPQKVRDIYWMNQAAEYKYVMFHKSHGTDRTLEVVNEEWDRYQADWTARGIVHDYVPYPYTREMIAEYFDEWSRIMKIPISID